MSVQTEIARLTSAKADLKAAIETKGGAVPAAATLDAYGDLVRQIPGGEAYLDKASYDPQGKKRDIFAEIAAGTALYTATFRMDAWTGGGPYTQTVSATPEGEAPALTAAMALVNPFGFQRTGVDSTDKILKSTLNILCGLGAHVEPGAGTLTVSVPEKPASDLEVWFAAREVNENA